MKPGMLHNLVVHSFGSQLVGVSVYNAALNRQGGLGVSRSRHDRIKHHLKGFTSDFHGNRCLRG